MKLRLTINDKSYEVDVEVLQEDQVQGQSQAAGRAAVPVATAAPVAATPAQPATAAAGPADEKKAFRSPISGVVFKVPVKVGQQVKANDVLMILEAMKMETVVAAEFDGKIARIHAQEGDSVQVKQVLVEFE